MKLKVERCNFAQSSQPSHKTWDIIALMLLRFENRTDVTFILLLLRVKLKLKEKLIIMKYRIVYFR